MNSSVSLISLSAVYRKAMICALFAILLGAYQFWTFLIESLESFMYRTIFIICR